jgi:bifunctional UDP-N-acetylglucosamine pyrophosphorylase / glucosamine-1-phosphate N-acetyltransferase
METNNTRAIILAAGRSSRFNTNKSKLIYTVCGQPMILFPLKILHELKIPATIVVNYQANEIKEVINNAKLSNIDYVTQEKRLGTGNAVACTSKTWDKDNVLILNGDSPLLSKQLIKDLIEKHKSTNATLSFLSAHTFNPFGYGRVIKDGKKVSIVEEKNCTEDQKNITLVNTGIYLISKKFLVENIGKIEKNPVSEEYYITDLANMASEQNLKVNTISVPYDYVRGVNTLEELWAAEQIKRSQIIKNLMAQGVRFELAQSIHIDEGVEIGADSFIGTGAHIIAPSKIGKNCKINAFTIIENTTIDDNTHIHSHSVVQDSKIGSNVHVGPFARLRNNVEIGNNANIGNFVEVKNSKIDESSKAKHLSYLGDAQIGKNVNIGAGTITCNYDGTNKNQTIIEDNSFIGSNNSLVAPVKIEKNSYTAAGSTINQNVPQDSLAIARSKQENKKDYIKKINNKNKKNQCCSNNTDSKLNFMGAVKTNGIKEENL